MQQSCGRVHRWSPARAAALSAPPPARGWTQRSCKRRPVPSGRAAAGADSGGGEESSGGTSGGGGQEPELTLRQQANLLNDLFYSAAAPVSSLEGSAEEELVEAQEASQSAPAAAPPGALRVLRDLPLWRVQWAALPGHQEVLHCHVPHYTSMFERLFRQPQPWRFGHLYLPDGSKNLGNDEYALAPGTKAPLAGTLMEVLQVCRFGDGRLIILAVGVARFRVVNPTQALPYSRADVEVLCDAEEQEQLEPLALQALESVQNGLDWMAGEGLDLAALMRTVPTAAREAAIAYSNCWLEYELSAVRPEDEQTPPIIDGTRTSDAQLLGRRLAALASNEVVQLPFFDAVTSGLRADALAAATDAAVRAGEPSGGGEADAAAGADAAAAGADAAAAGAGQSGIGSALQAALEAERPVLRQTEAAAYAQATSAASRCIAQELHLPGINSSSSGSGSDDAAGAAKQAEASSALPLRAALNTVGDRGLETQAPEAVLGDDCLEGEPDSLAVAVRLEAAVWAEIDAVQALAGKLRSHAAPLPEGVQCLRPPPPAGAAAAAAAAAADGQREDAEVGQQEGGAAASAAAGPAAKQHAVAPPDFPALRRTQRLSFACAALLANVSATEGRQAWVEAGSVCARLRLGLAALRKHRQVLAAVVAVEGL